VRRLVACCVMAMTFFAALAALRRNDTAIVSAASSSGNLVLFLSSSTGGCPLGIGYTFCDEVPGAATPASVFNIQASTAVSGLAVSFAAIPGLTSNFAAGDFTITSNTCAGNLAANQQCQVSVEFSPTTIGLREAALAITDAGGDKLMIIVAGTGKNLAIAPPGNSCTLADNAWTYCTTLVAPPAPPTATFTVVAGIVATGINVSLAATPGLVSEFASGDFTISSNGCTALPAGGSCAVNVEFTPTAAGLRAAALTATDSNGDSSSIYLAGSTTSGLFFDNIEPGSNSAPCARVNFFGFCNEPQGGTTQSSVFTVTNTSGTEVTGLTITPPIPTIPPTQPTPPPANFTAQSTTCTPTLAAGASCTINVAFTPQNTGLLQGQVTVTDAQGDVAGLNLAGTGDDYNLTLASSQPTETTIEQGQTATIKAQVTADNVFGANGEMVMFACPETLPNFSTCSFTPCPVSMTPGATTSFSIVIVTSSKTVTAPTVTNPCGGTATTSNLTREPTLALHVGRNTRESGRFPPLFLLLSGAISLIGCSIAARRKRLSLSFAAVGLATLVFVGCHHGATTIETPTGVYPLTITGNALDANGNALNASRSLSFTLDVITEK
jgi:hypothetical protein